MLIECMPGPLVEIQRPLRLYPRKAIYRTGLLAVYTLRAKLSSSPPWLTALSRWALAAVLEANDFPDKRFGDKNVLSLNFLSRSYVVLREPGLAPIGLGVCASMEVIRLSD